MPCLPHFPNEHFEGPKFFQKWFMGQESNIFGVVVGFVCCAAFVDFLLAFRFMRINPFQDAQTPATFTRYGSSIIDYSLPKVR